MVRGRLLQLAEKRARLAERARTERESLAALVARGDEASRVVSRVLGTGERLLQELRRQPLLVIAGAALLTVLKPRLALRWLARGWGLWRLYRGLRRWWQRLAGAPT